MSFSVLQSLIPIFSVKDYSMPLGKNSSFFEYIMLSLFVDLWNLQTAFMNSSCLCSIEIP